MASRNDDRPNVVVILTDDQGPWAMGCAGTPELYTPNLDRLAATGMRFESFFCASPVCSPARASLLTGRIPSQHGVHDWLSAGNSVPSAEPKSTGELIEYLSDIRGYTDVLAENGYSCGISGKWHLGDSHHPQKGFSFWEVHTKGGGPYYKAPMVDGDGVRIEEGYITDVFTDTALTFLNRQLGNEDIPFYLSLHYTAPHSPWGKDQHPAELWDDYHENCDFESVPWGLTAPAWAERLSIPVETEALRRSHLSGYFAAITAMDANVGRVLDWLETNGLRDNTLVFFTSDNGMSMGHHGVFGKGNATFPMNMFDTAVKVPAIISRPGHIPENVVNGDLLSHYDFMPTLLDYLELPMAADDELPGKSFAPLLRGESLDDRGPVVVYDEYGPVRMIRTKDLKYIHRYPYGPHELYDLRNDPNETTNLYEADAYAEQVRVMRAKLNEWFLRYVDPAIDGTKEPVTGRGQLRRAGLGANGLNNYDSP